MDVSAVATTTVEEDKHTAAARITDLIWEITQALIAMSVVGTVIYVNMKLAIYGREVNEVSSSALMQLNVLGGIIVGFYFGRTNHARRGGVVERKG